MLTQRKQRAWSCQWQFSNQRIHPLASDLHPTDSNPCWPGAAPSPNRQPPESRRQALVGQDSQCHPIGMMVTNGICWALPVCQMLRLRPIPLPSVIPHDIACPDWEVLLTTNCPNYNPRDNRFNKTVWCPVLYGTTGCHPCNLNKPFTHADWRTASHKNLDGTDTNYEADGAGGRKMCKDRQVISM